MKKFLCTFFVAFLLVFSLFLLKDFNDSISKKAGEIVYFEYNFLNHPFKYLFFKVFKSDTDKNFEWRDTKNENLVILYEYIVFDDAVFVAVIDQKNI